MSRLRFALLNAAHDNEDPLRNFRREFDADLVEFDANSCQLPDSFDFDGVVITGSQSSVYWDEEWIPPLIDYVAEAAERDLPILGVCYGHQVLAEALGGRVSGMDDYEIGYREVERITDDELFEGIDETFTAFTTHSDTVVDLPSGAELLAKNEYGVHAFRDGHCWGVQFHPEYDRRSAREITEGKDLPEERIETVLEGINAENYAAACEAKRLFANFERYARRVREEGDAKAEAEGERFCARPQSSADD